MTEDYFIELSGNHKNLTLSGATHGKKENIFISNLCIGNDKALRFINEEVFGGYK